RADHHDRVNGIRRGLLDLLFGLAATISRLLAQLVLDMTFDCAPVSVERRDQLAICSDRPILLLPGGAGSSLLDAFGAVLELLEECLAAFAPRPCVVLMRGMHLLVTGRTSSAEERRYGEIFVRLSLPCRLAQPDVRPVCCSAGMASRCPRRRIGLHG